MCIRYHHGHEILDRKPFQIADTVGEGVPVLAKIPGELKRGAEPGEKGLRIEHLVSAQDPGDASISLIEQLHDTFGRLAFAG